MGLFRAIIGVAIETVKLPVSVVKDVVMFVPTGGDTHATQKNLERIKDEADNAN